jgi:hypothetical protein
MDVQLAPAASLRLHVIYGVRMDRPYTDLLLTCAWHSYSKRFTRGVCGFVISTGLRFVVTDLEHRAYLSAFCIQHGINSLLGLGNFCDVFCRPVGSSFTLASTSLDLVRLGSKSQKLSVSMHDSTQIKLREEWVLATHHTFHTMRVMLAYVYLPDVFQELAIEIVALDCIHGTRNLCSGRSYPVVPQRPYIPGF